MLVASWGFYSTVFLEGKGMRGCRDLKTGMGSYSHPLGLEWSIINGLKPEQPRMLAWWLGDANEA